jgi:hypothetical protein
MRRHEGSFALAALVLTAVLAVAVLSLAGGRLFRLFHPSSPSAGDSAPALPQGSERPDAGRRRDLGKRAAAAHPGLLSVGNGLELAAVDSVVCATGLLALATLLLKLRLDGREMRDYALFEVHLSMHDDAERRDLRDMVEALAAAVREWPVDRARHGQPFFALELHYGSGPDGMQFLIALRCERELAVTLQSILANAYPDVRVGQTDGAPPSPIRARLRQPGHVLRLRKERPFVYPLMAREQDETGSPTMEAVAQTQVMAEVPSSVRLQFTPAPLAMEGWARRRFRAHERNLARREQQWDARTAGLQSVLNQDEMRSAGRAQDSSLLWFEIEVAAGTGEQANRVAAALIARRGENRLQRRRMVLRQQLYRRRFPDAYPPLLPTLGFGGFHSLVSANEVAHLLTLPTARMKAVPVKRLTVPRLPPPPEIARADDVPVRLPEQPGADGDIELAADTCELPATG